MGAELLGGRRGGRGVGVRTLHEVRKVGNGKREGYWGDKTEGISAGAEERLTGSA